MASEQARQALRQFQSDGYALANRVSFHFGSFKPIKLLKCLICFVQVFNDSQIVVVKDNIKNAWSEFLKALRNFKESASQLTDPRILGEQLQIIFRDESELNFVFKTVPTWS